jgi:membrane-bound lytic murein transglycosylase D
MRFLATAFIFCGIASSGQAPKQDAPQVPHKMRFAGMTLSINAAAREEIQKDVDALTASPRYFNIKVERAKTYFPIIEKIFKEENVPDELKYLVIQESALISDAVSTSNAVGYWQFKAETAKQMGLKVNRRVDERMNIVASTKGAAKYFKESNTYFNNWLFVVQSYQMGIGGTMRSVSEEQFGERHMDVTPETYWYVRKYLAHKVAFEHALGGDKGQVSVTPVLASGISLDEISQKSGVDVQKLKDYNKWAIDGSVPDDADYTVVIPKGDVKDFNTLWLSSNKKNTVATANTASAAIVFKETQLNGLRAVVAPQRETVGALANRANVDLSDFMKWNDVSVDWQVMPGQIYYLQRKIKTSGRSSYTTKENESLWQVSQSQGVRLKSLKRMNPSLSDQLRPGTMVYLTNQSGKSNLPELETVELDHSSPFDWGISGKSEGDYVIKLAEPEPVIIVKETLDGGTSVSSEIEKREAINMDKKNVVAEKKESETIPKTEVPLTEKNKIETKAEPIAETHMVAAGESLYGIATKYGLKVEDIMRWNDLKNGDPIKPGISLKLIGNKAKEDERLMHEVKTTDTLYSIARQYGLSVKELMDINDKKDFEIKPGQKLFVKGN